MQHASATEAAAAAARAPARLGQVFVTASLRSPRRQGFWESIFLRYYHDYDMMELHKRQATPLAGSRLTAQGHGSLAGSCSSLARDNVICQRLNCRSACKRTVARGSSHWHHHNGRRRSLRASGSARYPALRLGSLGFKLPPGAAYQRRTPGGEAERPLLRRPFEGRTFFRESIFID
jgi:hypothetical protein